MTTPATMNSFVDWLRKELGEARDNFREAMKSDSPESDYGAGYSGGYADALVDVLRYITGDEE